MVHAGEGVDVDHRAETSESLVFGVLGLQEFRTHSDEVLAGAATAIEANHPGLLHGHLGDYVSVAPVTTNTTDIQIG